MNVYKFFCIVILSFSSLAGTESLHDNKEKFLTTEQFDKLTDDLRSTLAGNFVTVWRSEWKVKLSLEESNLYLQQLLERFLSSKTREVLLKDLDLSDEEFAQKVSVGFLKLQKDKKLVKDDRINIRDEGPSQGVYDSTFTYYTKPLSDEKGVAKHQIRLRSYLRRINLDEIKEDETCTAFTKLAEEIKITKLSNDKFNVTSTFDGAGTNATLLSSEVHELFGNPIILYSIPNGTFKFEIKTALKDEISSKRHPLLGGNHMVQKLDVSGLSFQQIENLFAPVSSSKELAGRIHLLEGELLEKNQDLKDRIQAVFAVLRQGVETYGFDFLNLEGVTHYQRSAFGGTCGFQTTFDREQEVYWKNIYGADGFLKDPREIILTSKCFVPKTLSDRHVELKFPSEAVAKTVGVYFYQTRGLDSAGDPDPEFQDTAAIYQQYPTDSSNQGKLKYLIDKGVLKP